MDPTDFVRPAGELNPDWFEDDLNVRLTAYLAQAAGELPDAAKAFVYWRAYDGLVADLMSAPAVQRDREKSDTFTDTQFAYWREQAAVWRARYHSARSMVRAAVGVAL